MSKKMTSPWGGMGPVGQVEWRGGGAGSVEGTMSKGNWSGH